VDDFVDVPVAAPPHLSRRQHEVAAHIAAGQTDVEIAKSLAISPRTVRMHCDALRVRLNVEKRRYIPIVYRQRLGRDPLENYLDRIETIDPQTPDL